ncbi:MAG: hypothetical protein KDC13_01510 [Bacteroidetes bacterium]|nr:hypothetical protein [Bacteroidota bacterium]
MFNFIKYNSVHRNKLNWDQEHQLFDQCINSAKNTSDTMRCFVSILEHLGDVHTQMYLSGNFYGNYPELNDNERGIYSAMMKIAESHKNKPEFKTLDKYLYILVPGYEIPPSEIDKYAQAFYDSVSYYLNDTIEGVILDFRYNSGGNVYPMLCGLYPLLGNENIIYETGPDYNIDRTWRLEDGKLLLNEYTVAKVDLKNKHLYPDLHVAVVIGPITISSGFVAAVAFRNRPNDIIMGKSTVSGYTTSNGYFQFPPNLSMNFSTNFICDRGKFVYEENLSPDLHLDDISDSTIISRAIKWFGEHK